MSDRPSSSLPAPSADRRGGESEFVWGPAQRKFMVWRPLRECRGAVIVSHGLCEHAARYRESASHLCEAGWAVVAGDHPGHGNSPGPRGHVDHWDRMIEGVQSQLDWADLHLPAGQRVVWGHSMGGNVALCLALRQPERMDGLLLSAPAVGRIPAPWWKKAGVLLLSPLRPTLQFKTNIQFDQLTRDTREERRIREDPLRHGVASARLGAELIRTAAECLARASELRTPVLILHGESDQVIPVANSRHLLDALAHQEGKLIVYPEGRHEPHHDTQRQVVFADMLKWLRRLGQ